jgi:general secretion pathway protein N
MIVVAAFAFLAILLLRLPLSWVRSLLPQQVVCEGPGGSVWQGRCAALTLNIGGSPLPVGPVNWKLRPSALLRAKLAGDVQVTGPQLRGRASFVVGSGGNAQIRELDAAAPLDRRLMTMVPPNWTGRLVVRAPVVDLVDGKLAAVSGTIEAHEVVAQGPRPDEFGSYALEFPPNGAAGGPFRGTLRDLDGPVELDGTLEVRSNLDWQLDANVKARVTATPQLSRLLEYLGPPDAQGRRPFSAAGDF